MRTPRIPVIGAGSSVFARTLIGDLLSYPAVAAARITLYDTHAKRLAESEILARRFSRRSAPERRSRPRPTASRPYLDVVTFCTPQKGRFDQAGAAPAPARPVMLGKPPCASRSEAWALRALTVADRLTLFATWRAP